MGHSTQKPRLIAVDTNFLLDYADGHAIVSECIATIRARLAKHQLVILPTTIQELAYLAYRGSDQKSSRLAMEAATCLLKWNISPLSCLPVGHGIVEQIAFKLRKRGLIPEVEINDSLIVAEAALAGVTLLISNDRHIKDIDPTMLKLELSGCDVETPLLASPWKIVRDFGK